MASTNIHRLTMRQVMGIAPRNHNWVTPTGDTLGFTFSAELLEAGVEPPVYSNPEALGAWLNGYFEGIAAAEAAIAAAVTETPTTTENTENTESKEN